MSFHCSSDGVLAVIVSAEVRLDPVRPVEHSSAVGLRALERGLVQTRLVTFAIEFLLEARRAVLALLLQVGLQRSVLSAHAARTTLTPVVPSRAAS